MKKTLQFYFALLGTSIRASMALRGAFLIESGLMLANNMIFFSIWWIFFNQFRTVGGWQIRDMTALLAIGSGAYGLLQICFGGTRQLAKTILSGDLDSYLTQPKNVLLHIAGSKSANKGWGHLMTSFLLIFFGGLTEPRTLCLVLVSLVTGCMVYTSFRVIVHSLTFWLGPIESLSEKYADSLFLFALYPTNIYSGLMQLLMFTLLPAGIITYLPVEMIRDFSLEKLIVLLLSASCFPFLAFFVFYKGLRHYESGNRFASRI